MKITLAKPSTTAKECDLLIASAFKSPAQTKKPAKSNKPTFAICNNIKELDLQLQGHLLDSASSEGFSADAQQRFVIATLGQVKAKLIALVGLGDPNDQSIDGFRKSAGEAYKLSQEKHARKLIFIVPEKVTLPIFDVVQALAEGFKLASYNFDRYQTRNKKENYLQEIIIHLPLDPSAEHNQALKHAENIADAVCLARDLINEGPRDLDPEQFAKYAKQGAADSGLLIEVLDEKKLKKENMGLMLAVGCAMEDVAPPRLIRLHYKPKKPSKKIISLVGKGVTFDSGGLDIKPADGMLDMKVDMSGAAAVFGIMCAIGKIKPNVEVVGYLACVENGIGPKAYHPGDVITSKKGLTVEISNTDAEGRLVLADTITYTLERDKPQIIIDLATLTGSCMVALGLKTAGLFSNDKDLAESINSNGEAAGESFWRMPLNQDLKEGLKSNIADLKNCGDRWGGSITAALFLEEFVGKDVKWAHLDIAGPATNSKAHPYLGTGGTGFGIRTLVSLLLEHN